MVGESKGTVEQVERVLATMATQTVFDRRDRALVAFAAMTGARAKALTTIQLNNVNMAGGYVDQDARQVETKFAKSFRTYFMPVCKGALTIIDAWVDVLTGEHLWGPI